MFTLSKAVIVLITLIVSSQNASAYWKDSFYTDDSTYHLKLYKDGFKQLIRVHNNDCHQIKSIQVKTKISQSSIQSNSKRLTNLNEWPKIFGMKQSEYCFFQVRVTGVDSKKLGQFPYTLQIEESSGNHFYFQGLTNSVLPSQRITNQLSEWIYLGGFGATLLEDKQGVLYKVWEPYSEKVFLNHAGKKITMYKETTADYQKQFHYKYVNGSKAGDKYFYEFQKNGKLESTEVANNDRWSTLKVDPYAKEIAFDKKGGSVNGYINPYSVVEQDIAYQWNYDHLITSLSDQDYNNWLMYQVWPLTFAPKQQNGVYSQGTFNDITNEIPYIQDLGVNAVELLPVNESRFHATWGYAMDSIFLITKDYGSRTDLKKLVDSLHQKKLKVVFDVVINHINNYLLREPLSKTVQKSKFYGGTTDWGPKPDFKNVMVQKWILDALLSLKRDFHIDGFRFDMIEVVFHDSQEGYEFIQNFNQIFYLESPRFFSTAEQLPDNVWTTFPISQKGLQFKSQWNDKFKNSFERGFDFYRQKNKQVDLTSLANSLRGYSNHRSFSGEHHFGAPSRTVNYLGSHDFIGNKDPIIRLVSDYESYEWEGNNHFFKVRPLTETKDRETLLRSLHNEFTHSLARTSYGVLFSKPGNILFFQGEEVGNDINIENEWSYIDAQKNGTTPSKNVNVDKYVSTHRMLWEYVNIDTAKETQFFTPSERNLFKGQRNFFKDLLNLRRNHPEISNSNPQYVDLLEKGQVLAYHLKNGFTEFFILANFGDAVSTSWFNFPGDAKTWWKEVINSSDKKYGSIQNLYQNPISNRGGRVNQVRLDGPSISIFQKHQKANIAIDLYLRGTFNNWIANNHSLLKKASDHGDIYMTELYVPSHRYYQFKIGSKSWDYELGTPQAQELTKALKKGQGYLSSVPHRPDAQIELKEGQYRFIFDIKTYKFSFIRL